MIPESVKTFGDAIRWAREQKRMTLRAFAAKAGVSAPFASDVEHDRRHPSDIEKWAALLDVPAKELIARRAKKSMEEWAKKNPELAAWLKEQRPPRQRCWCPWCKLVLD